MCCRVCIDIPQAVQLLSDNYGPARLQATLSTIAKCVQCSAQRAPCNRARVRQAETSRAAFCRILSNIIANPTEPKFRSIKLTSDKIQARQLHSRCSAAHCFLAHAESACASAGRVVHSEAAGLRGAGRVARAQEPKHPAAQARAAALPANHPATRCALQLIQSPDASSERFVLRACRDAGGTHLQQRSQRHGCRGLLLTRADLCC